MALLTQPRPKAWNRNRKRNGALNIVLQQNAYAETLSHMKKIKRGVGFGRNVFVVFGGMRFLRL